jgi:hypothetical protein
VAAGERVDKAGHPIGVPGVSQHDQVTAGLEFAVGQPPGPGLGVRDSDSGHTLKCPPGGPVLPGRGPRLSDELEPQQQWGDNPPRQRMS